jgi:hypothetical protein
MEQGKSGEGKRISISFARPPILIRLGFGKILACMHCAETRKVVQVWMQHGDPSSSNVDL